MSKKTKITMIALLAVVVLALSFGAGYNLASRTRSTSAQGLDLVVEAWNLLFDNYVERDKLDATTL
ncbi:MAG: hypothetical protein KAT75_07630, partial [Dehalococcoidia bacterium]|nr:hypothetical protein [Dehalococcoidia bacterium]